MNTGLPFAALLLLFAIASAQDQNGSLDSLALAPKKAKTLLRVRRGWGSFRRKLNPFERREEADENRKTAQRNERAREARVYAQHLARVCPTRCWTGWGAFGGCSQPCGGGGFKQRTRRVKNAQELGECGSWVASHGCQGPNRQTAACNRFCHNQGTLNPSGCSCKAGWKNQCCDTRITCPDPGKPSSGLVTPSGSGLHHGTVVRFSCNTGYTLAGHSTRQCVGTGTWTNSVPTCNIVRCPTPTNPAHGSHSLVSGASGAYVYGNSMRVECNTGYALRGDAIRKCQANGQWAGTPASCSQIICSQHNAPSHGTVSFPGGRTLNTDVSYSCNSGYHLQGAPTRKCQSNGQWTGALPSCQRIKCNNMGAPSHGSVSFEGQIGSSTAHGGKAKFTCDSGYVVTGTATLTCSGTSLQGSWSGRTPTCEPVNCGDPGTPSNGVKVGSVLTLGGSVSFKCVAGYRLSGAPSRQCQNNGKWSASKPQCLKCGADTFKAGTNALTTCTSCPAHSTTSGSTGASSRTSCVCGTGYRGASGGPCSRITCPSLGVPHHAMKKSCSNDFGGKCLFECKPGHVVSRGDVTRTCEGNGAWSGQNVVCTACPVNTYKKGISQCSACPDHTSTAGTGHEKAGCRCNSGWTGPHGGPCQDVNECQGQNGGCQQQCVNSVGSFRCECNQAGFMKDSEDHKKCNPKSQCKDMVRPTHGGLTCHSHKSTNTERCQATCNKGYEHVLSPNAFEECGPTTNWKWSHEISGKPILDCFEAFFEEVQLELEVFYFSATCTGLTAVQKAQIKRQFVSHLNQRGICQGHGTCKIDDVTIECEGSKRRKRSPMERMKITFKLKSVARSRSKMSNCNAACKSRYMNSTRAQLMEVSERAARILTVNRPTPQSGRVSTFSRHGTAARPSPVMTLAGVALFGSGLHRGQMTTTCSGNMIRTADICATCPSGSYKVQARDECSLCPIGSYQPRDGQTLCLPCRTANTRGSKACS